MDVRTLGVALGDCDQPCGNESKSRGSKDDEVKSDVREDGPCPSEYLREHHGNTSHAQESQRSEEGHDHDDEVKTCFLK